MNEAHIDARIYVRIRFEYENRSGRTSSTPQITIKDEKNERIMSKAKITSSLTNDSFILFTLNLSRIIII